MHTLHRHIALCAALLAPAAAIAQQSRQPERIRGFPGDALAEQHRREEQARAVPSADTLRERMRLLSDRPHEAGTDRSRRVAELILQRFRSAGLDAQIEQFEALMPRPVSRVLEMTAPVRFTAALRETPVAGDKDSGDAFQLPTYNAYSPDGDVTAPLVFVNYGLPEDYKILDSLGISVRGRIVIAKYGRSWRGIKPKLAAEHGAVACIIYSDPRDDGFFHEEPYPKGPMRPSQGVQRGSVMDMPTYPGDPLSPGWASERGARKLSMAEARTIEPIPVLPISSADAQPLLARLGGPVAPESWRGALPITYRVGPGAVKVRLAVKFDWATRPLYNVVARIPGARSPDQWIIYGNHHDAWVNGAEDPISGMTALEETARSFGALLKSGWRPARTIILIGWDGEEWGLLGSTEWAEKHRDELRQKGVVYINSDVNGRGVLGVDGSHSLQTWAAEVARDIRDPRTGRSALDMAVEKRRSAQQPRPTRDDSTLARRDSTADTSAAQRRLQREMARLRGDLAQQQAVSRLLFPRVDTLFPLGALGSGSDYTAFLDHVNIPSVNIAYGGESRSGIYHSIYDSFDFFRRFLDSTFVYGVAEAQTTATAILRLADAPVLPFEFTNVVRTYRTYVDEIEKGARANEATRSLDLSAVRRSLDDLQQAAERYERAVEGVHGASHAALRDRWARLAPVNTLLYQTEQTLGDARGLPGREWFRHLIYAPGYYTGYGVKTMPGIREAVEDKPNGEGAQREAARVAAAISRMAAKVSEAAAMLEAALR